MMSFGNITQEHGLEYPYDQVFSINSGEGYLFQHLNGSKLGDCPNEVRVIPMTWDGRLRVSEPTSKTRWDKYYFAMTPLSVENRFFCYGQNETDRDWFIQEISNGILGDVTAKGAWGMAYSVMRSIQVAHASFLIYHNDTGEGTSKDFFVQKVVPGGTLGETTESQKWNNHYPTIVPIEFNDRAYIFGQTRHNNYWFIQEVDKNGKLGPYVDGTLPHFFDEAVAFRVGVKQYLYLSSKGSSSCPGEIREVTLEGKMGEATAQETAQNFYSQVASFNASRSFIYGQQLDGNRHFIVKEMMPASG